MDKPTDWSARSDLVGTVDFTMMFAAHDAFSRDIARMITACKSGRALAPENTAAWDRFKRFLLLRHRTEDTVLFLPLRAAVDDPLDLDMLAAMDVEHARIDPLLDLIDAALADADYGGALVALHESAEELGAHMRHEERRALPLLEARLGRAGWDAFGRSIRKEQGLRGAAEYLPWLLDDAPSALIAAVLKQLPLPARVLYRRVWAPRYHSPARAAA
ncbi:hypothetical protein B4N89_37545 [Embleya scabrispora]|uniref:Hemerythrin-like domain-containing protein n=1 Tax=Embleya scabrispora TaxID=159449 RepID=A0A1T3NM29_9ACTN|nr:hemerythrin domain-containing protein [Embleya scabrispora]OPC77943.1 hypothetical protein B4N89_37545 [Embleya scabrispora]